MYVHMYVYIDRSQTTPFVCHLFGSTREPVKVLVQIEVKAAVSFTVDLCTCIWPFLCMNKT